VVLKETLCAVLEAGVFIRNCHWQGTRCSFEYHSVLIQWRSYYICDESGYYAP